MTPLSFLLCFIIYTPYIYIITISVEIIANKPEENISKKVLGWDAMMQTTRQIFDDIDEGKISTGAVVKKIIAGKIKAKNVRTLTKLDKIQALLKSEKKVLKILKSSIL